MSNNNVPGSNQNVNVQVRALTIDPAVTVQYKTKILHKNVVNGVNTLTQAMMNETNTKYVIKYDYVLGENITVPDNCVLEFDGGSIGGRYSIKFNNTKIFGNAKIYTDIANDSTIDGDIYVSWFDNGDADSTQCLTRIKKLLVYAVNPIVHFQQDKQYLLTITTQYFFELPSNTIIKGNNAKIKIADNCNTSTFTWNSLFFVGNYKKNVTIENIHLDCNGANNIVTYTSGYDIEDNGLLRCADTTQNVIKNILVNNCSIENSNGGRAIHLSFVNNITITNCRFIDIGPVNGSGSINDHSTIMGVGKNWTITNNYLYNSTKHLQGTGLDLGCSNSVIENNTVINSCFAMNLVAESGYDCANNVICNNRFVEAELAIRIWTIDTGVNCHDNIIDNNIIEFTEHISGDGYCRGILFGDNIYNTASNFKITNNIFTSKEAESTSTSNEFAIKLGNTNSNADIKDISISGNTFKNLTGSVIGLRQANVHKITINNNFMIDCGLRSGSAYIDITPDVSKTIFDVEICGNTIENVNSSSDYGIEVPARNVYNLIVKNNTIKTENSIGIKIISTGINKSQSDERLSTNFIHVEHITSKLIPGVVNNIVSDLTSYIIDPFTSCEYKPSDYFTTTAWKWIGKTNDIYPNSVVASPPSKNCLLLTTKPFELGALGWIYNGTTWTTYCPISVSSNN